MLILYNYILLISLSDLFLFFCIKKINYKYKNHNFFIKKVRKLF